MITAPILPAPPAHRCAVCPAPAVWATRAGLRCTACTHPAHLRLARANAVAAETWGAR